MEILDLGTIFALVALVWSIFGFIEYTWYLGLYRSYPNEYVTESFQEELKNSPFFSRFILLVTSMVFGPVFVIRNFVITPRPFILSLY